jgi:hypothetical protein
MLEGIRSSLDRLADPGSAEQVECPKVGRPMSDCNYFQESRLESLA